MAIGYGEACPKPTRAARLKAKRKERRTDADRVHVLRMYVMARERGICRCCRTRPAESMHELVPKSLRGHATRQNSVGVCGDGVQGCHGFLQRHEIEWEAVTPHLRAEGTLDFWPLSRAACDWMHLSANEILQSAPMREMESE